MNIRGYANMWVLIVGLFGASYCDSVYAVASAKSMHELSQADKRVALGLSYQLHRYARTNNAPLIRWTLGGKNNKYAPYVNANQKNWMGARPIEIAVAKGNLQAVNALLAYSNPNKRGWKGNTPLHLAIKKGYDKIVDALIKANANPRIKNNKGETPIDIAIRKKYAHIRTKLEAIKAAVEPASAAPAAVAKPVVPASMPAPAVAAPASSIAAPAAPAPQIAMLDIEIDGQQLQIETPASAPVKVATFSHKKRTIRHQGRFSRKRARQANEL